MKKEFMNKGMLQSKRKATGFNWERFDFNSKIFINLPGLEQNRN